jgi:cation:H+ antiporter
MDFMTVILLIIGLGLLVGGAELLVRGASRLAVTVGISPLVVGLTVVSFGTSAPELAVGMQSAWAGEADIALGNVIGSNIFNVLVVLGACAAIIPLTVSRQLIRLDVPILIGATLLMLLFGMDGLLGRVDGLLLTIGLIAYTGFTIQQSRKDMAEENRVNDDADAADDVPLPVQTPRALLVNLGLIIGGLGMLVVGAEWLVNGAVALATFFGISSLIIGLTVVAVGTSLPEVATSIVAALRGERDMAVGNVVGSSIFNIFAILGLTSLVAPAGIAVPMAAIQFDIPVMLLVALACLPIFFTGLVVSRREGILLLGYYVLYALFLFLNAVNHEALGLFSAAMFLVMPLTMFGLVIHGVKHAHANLRKHGSIMGEVVSR